MEVRRVLFRLEKFMPGVPLPEKHLKMIQQICEGSEAFSEMITANTEVLQGLPAEEKYEEINVDSFSQAVQNGIESYHSFRDVIDLMRSEWSKIFLRIGIADLLKLLTMREINLLQTELAEASVRAALVIVEKEIAQRFERLEHR